MKQNSVGGNSREFWGLKLCQLDFFQHREWNNKTTKVRKKINWISENFKRKIDQISALLVFALKSFKKKKNHKCHGNFVKNAE